MDINKLQTFLDVAKYGSFLKVAEKEFLSQRAVSKQITQLETELGVTLFQRQSNKIVLTPQGKFFLSSAQDIVSNYANAVVELNKITDQVPLRLGYFSAFEKKLLQDALLPIVTANPELPLTIREESNEHLTESVSNGSLDAALSISYGKPSLTPGSKLKSLDIFRGQMVIGVSELNPLSQKKALDPEDLKDQTILYYSPESSTFLLESFLASMNSIVDNEKIQRVTSAEQMSLLVSLNQALAFFPAGLLSDYEMNASHLKLLPINRNVDQIYNIVVIYDPNNKNPSLKKFLKSIQSS